MNTFDEELREWGRRHRLPRTRAVDEALIQRIVARLPAAAGPRAAPRRAWGRWLTVAAALLAVGVTASAAAWWYRGTWLPRAGAGLPAAELAELQRVVAEVDRLFPEGVTWISSTNGQLSLQPAVRQRVSLPGHPDQRVLISYTVSRRAAAEAWVPLARQDIVTYADEPVRLPRDRPGSLWCHVTDDRHAVTEVSLSFPAGTRQLHVNTGVLQPLGTPTVVWTAEVGNAHYRVTQTVQLLSGDESAPDLPT